MRWGYWSEQCSEVWNSFPVITKLNQENINKFINNVDRELHVAAVLYSLHAEFQVSIKHIDKAIKLLSKEKETCKVKARKWAIDYEIKELQDAKNNNGYGVSTSVFEIYDTLQ